MLHDVEHLASRFARIEDSGDFGANLITIVKDKKIDIAETPIAENLMTARTSTSTLAPELASRTSTEKRVAASVLPTANEAKNTEDSITKKSEDVGNTHTDTVATDSAPEDGRKSGEAAVSAPESTKNDSSGKEKVGKAEVINEEGGDKV